MSFGTEIISPKLCKQNDIKTLCVWDCRYGQDGLDWFKMAAPWYQWSAAEPMIEKLQSVPGQIAAHWLRDVGYAYLYIRIICTGISVRICTSFHMTKMKCQTVLAGFNSSFVQMFSRCDMFRWWWDATPGISSVSSNSQSSCVGDAHWDKSVHQGLAGPQTFARSLKTFVQFDALAA